MTEVDAVVGYYRACGICGLIVSAFLFILAALLMAIYFKGCRREEYLPAGIGAVLIGVFAISLFAVWFPTVLEPRGSFETDQRRYGKTEATK